MSSIKEYDIMQINVRTKVTQGGRIVIPAEMRKQLGIEIGEDVNLSLEEGAVNISTSKSALERLQKAAQTVAKGNVSVVDELIAERRSEAENE